MSALYAFSAHTFTNAGATGRTGPILSAVRTAYSNAAWAQDITNNWLNMTSDNGIQLWTVPKTGTYTIEAYGAQGGNADTATGGLGARIKISTTLVKNNIIKILCGQQGGTASVASGYDHPIIAGGGGGGTYIYNVTTSSIILIAGGGGGAAKGDLNSSHSNGKYILNGVNATAYNVASGSDGTAGGNNTYGKGGMDGDSGTVGNAGGSSGAGWNGSGVQGMYGGVGGLSFNSGGTGGENIVHSGSFVINTEGGFGGGSGSGFHSNFIAAAGGGGGYSGGGGGGQAIGGGGGGGNYMIADSTYISSSTNTGHGSVTVTYTPIITAAEYESTFSSHTFTNAGATGRTGPILSAVRTAYSNAEWAQDITNHWLNMTSDNGIQLWTVPKTGTYTIRVAGAAGASHNLNSSSMSGVGLGYQFTTEVNLIKGQVYAIVIGQRATPTTSGNESNGGGGGGGGSFIWNNNSKVLLSAAGGGGGRAIENVNGGVNILSETYGLNGVSDTLATLFNYDTGKTTYNSYFRANNGQNGGNWTSASSSGYTNTGGRGWTEMINATDFTGRAANGYGSIPGFGGGSTTAHHGGGGGGGYSGGGSLDYNVFAGLDRSGGGGGSSYSASAMNNTGTNTNENGSVTVTYTPTITAAEYESTFSAHTFTNAGATGRTGPILSAVRTAYSNAAWAQDITNNWLNMTSDNGIQLWTVPATGAYVIKAAGAGGTTSNAGRGYIITSTHNLTQGQIIKILVGQVGTNADGRGGGGGGTFIATNTNTPLVVCGGGGATNINNNAAPIQDAVGTGGSDTAGADGGGGSTGGCGMYGSGGASFTYNSIYAKSFVNGGVGGPMPDLGCVTISYGGFGGGGGGGNGGGGGGGYTGGKGGDNIYPYTGGSGGGSYCSTTVTSTDYNIAGAEGYVTVTYTAAAGYESTFSAHTFTNAGATGRTGPILSAVRTAYSNAAWAQDTTNNWLNMTSNNGIQLWTVPKTGTYTIEAYGAQGGNADTATGGLGARIKISTTLVKNNIIKILCGQQGGTASVGSVYGHPAIAGGGGGGTYIYNITTSSIILIAGGGGGAAKGSLDSSYIHARYIWDGSNASAYNVLSGTDGRSSAGASGKGGSDGNAGTTGNGGGSSGAGWNGPGVKGTYGGGVGLSFNSGGTGGENIVHNGSFVINTEGGFGGGSGAGLHLNYESDAGGGGGYSGGGGGGAVLGTGGGGGNYMITGSTYISSSTNTGHGSVTITLIRASPATLSFIKNVYYQKYIINSTFSIPSSSIITSNTDTSSFSVTHSSPGNAGIITVTNSANTGTVTVKGIGTVTITSTIAATANFTETTVALITVVIVGAGTRYSNLDLNSIDLSATDITGTTFSGCDLTSANLYGSTISSTTDFSTVTSMSSLRSGRIIGVTTLLPTGYKMI